MFDGYRKSCGIQLIFFIRQGYSPHKAGKNGKDKDRWKV